MDAVTFSSSSAIWTHAQENDLDIQFNLTTNLSALKVSNAL